MQVMWVDPRQHSISGHAVKLNETTRFDYIRIGWLQRKCLELNEYKAWLIKPHNKVLSPMAESESSQELSSPDDSPACYLLLVATEVAAIIVKLSKTKQKHGTY